MKLNAFICSVAMYNNYMDTYRLMVQGELDKPTPEFSNALQTQMYEAGRELITSNYNHLCNQLITLVWDVDCGRFTLEQAIPSARFILDKINEQFLLRQQRAGAYGLLPRTDAHTVVA